MKKIISVFAAVLCLAVTLSVTALAAEGGAAPVFGGTVSTSGSSIHVTVALEEGTNVHSGQLTVSYDVDMVTLEAVTLGESVMACDIRSFESGNTGEVELGFAGAKAVPVGTLLELDFTAKADGFDVFTVTVSEYSVGPEGEKGTVHTDYAPYNLFEGGSSVPGTPGTPGTPDEPFRFVDVAEGSWYEDAVYELYELGIIEGVGDDKYEPGVDIDRASIAMMVYRLAGRPAVTGGKDFADVNSGDWYYDAVKWASEVGYMIGLGDGTFGAKDTITRQDMIVTLWRYARANGYDMSVEGFTMPDYSDIDSVADYAGEAMTWAVKAGISNGVGGNRLAPTETASRAEVATLIYRMISLR